MRYLFLLLAVLLLMACEGTSSPPALTRDPEYCWDEGTVLRQVNGPQPGPDAAAEWVSESAAPSTPIRNGRHRCTVDDMQKAGWHRDPVTGYWVAP